MRDNFVVKTEQLRDVESHDFRNSGLFRQWCAANSFKKGSLALSALMAVAAAASNSQKPLVHGKAASLLPAAE
jgi:hypothetical protein